MNLNLIIELKVMYLLCEEHIYNSNKVEEVLENSSCSSNAVNFLFDSMRLRVLSFITYLLRGIAYSLIAKLKIKFLILFKDVTIKLIILFTNNRILSVLFLRGQHLLIIL